MAKQSTSALWQRALKGVPALDIGEGCVVYWVEITPRLAMVLLENNTHNRNRSHAREAEFAGAMRRDEWRARNGTTIVEAKDGTLLDGQTRLEAIVQSGHSQFTLFVTGAEMETQETMDVGRTRSMADALTLRGQTNATELASAVRYLFFYEHGATFRTLGMSPTKAQLFDTLRRYPELEDALPLARRAYAVLKPLKMSVGTVLAMLFVRANHADGNVFFTRLADGLHLNADDPIYALRRALSTAESSGSHKRVEPWHHAALTIKAFNYWRRGESVKLLRFVAGGAAAEPFPLVEGVDLLTGHSNPKELNQRHHDMARGITTVDQ